MVDTSVVIAALLSDTTYRRLMECRAICYTLSYVLSEVAKHWDRLARWRAGRLSVSLEEVMEEFKGRMEAMMAKLRKVPEDLILPY